jgi:hypothetical protein
MEIDIHNLITGDIERANKSVSVVDNCYFNQKETIERIIRYINSQYEYGNIDADGDYKYFYNIINNPLRTTTKAIDFDTKDINVLTDFGGDPVKTWYINRDLKFWMKDKQFSKILNRLFIEIPMFGSSVLKVVNNKPYFVDLRNFKVSPEVESLDASDFIIERHSFYPDEFIKTAKEMGWEWENVISNFRERKDTFIEVYERYGWYDGSYKHIFWTNVGVGEKDARTNQEMPSKGETLSITEVSKHPYYEFHFEKIIGRWLGRGIPELLFDAQVRLNENENLQAKGSSWSALRLFFSTDPTIQKNLATDVSNGDVIVGRDLNEVSMIDRNLAYFQQITQRWLSNRDENCLTYDVIQGSGLPSGTPLGSANLAANMAGGWFDFIREQIAEDVKNLLWKEIIPNFQKENNKEHTLRLVGEDLDAINELLRKQSITDKIKEYISKNLKLPTSKMVDAFKAVIDEKILSSKERLLTIPKDFYKDLKYKIDIVITGESKDARIYAQTLLSALQAITADATLLTDPIKKKMFARYLEQGGVFMSDILNEKPKEMTEQPVIKGSGGGVSRPQPMPNMAMAMQQTI